MGLPLPRIVSDVGPGGPLVTAMRGVNALSSDMLGNQIKSAQADYAPYTTYADAASKLAYANMLPYQIKATMLSNPMLWMAMKDHPEAMQNMMNSFSQSIPQGNQLFGGINLPQPNGSRGNGLLNMIINQFMGKNNQANSPNDSPMNGVPMASAPIPNGQPGNNPMTSMQNSSQGQSSNALIPAMGGGVAGTQGKMIAPYVQSPYKEGALIPDPNHPGQFISVPTSNQTTQLQNQLAAAQRTIPQLQSLGDLWKPFMTLKGKAFLQAARIGNLTGYADSDLPSKYADAKLSAFTTVESYLKSIGVPVTVDVQKDLKEMIEPYPGENAKGYSSRIEKATQRIISDFANQSVKQLGGGYQSNTFSGQGTPPKNTKVINNITYTQQPNGQWTY